MVFAKRGKKRNILKSPSPAVAVSAHKKRQSFASERAKKIAVSKFSNIVKLVLIGGGVLTILFVIFGIIGFFALSLKSGSKNPLQARLESFIAATPLKNLIKTQSTQSDSGDVIGLTDVPVYPDSEFTFKDLVKTQGGKDFSLQAQNYSQTDLQQLYTFLASGQSVYRLPIKISWEDVQDYYKKELPKRGWTFTQSVALSETEKIPGDYYVKDEKGLHIYDVSYDIWYETITKDQAIQGLRDQIVAYRAKQEQVQAATGNNLPSETWWQLKYSKDWSLEMAKHPVYGEENLVFTHDKTKERVTLTIIGRFPKAIADVDYKYLSDVGTNQIISWLSTQQTSVTLGGFTKTQSVIGGDMKALEYFDTKHNAYFLFMVNKYNGLTYALQYFGNAKPEFYEYIKANIKAIKR